MPRIILSLILAVFGFSTVFAAPVSPVGYWKTIDDVSGQPKSILHLQQESNGTVSGSIVKIWPKPGKDENEVCEACEGEKHNQRIVGMTILTGLKPGESEWEDGRILDPSNGKSYHCMVRVVDNGNKLHVRGYIGMPLLGRTQTWLRVNKR